MRAISTVPPLKPKISFLLRNWFTPPLDLLLDLLLFLPGKRNFEKRLRNEPPNRRKRVNLAICFEWFFLRDIKKNHNLTFETL